MRWLEGDGVTVMGGAREIGRRVGMCWTVVDLSNCLRNLVAVRGRASRGGAKRDSPGQRNLTNLTKSNKAVCFEFEFRR